MWVATKAAIAADKLLFGRCWAAGHTFVLGLKLGRLQKNGKGYTLCLHGLFELACAY